MDVNVSLLGVEEELYDADIKDLILSLLKFPRLFVRKEFNGLPLLYLDFAFDFTMLTIDTDYF